MQYSDFIGQFTEGVWIAFILVWLVSAFFAKGYSKRSGGKWLAMRLLFVIVAVTIIRASGAGRGILLWHIADPSVRWIGLALVILGTVLAFSARYHLGRNWGMPMSEKKDAELVTSGPYAYIRHPIYAALFLSILGSSLVFGFLWAMVLVMYVAFFSVSIFREDAIMEKLFPATYPSYKAKTKRVIPWVW